MILKKNGVTHFTIAGNNPKEQLMIKDVVSLGYAR
jgi:hypothetical protein